MRKWRKLYSKILDSDQVVSLSLEAKWMLTLLIAAQDDSGYYPWTQHRVQRLTPSCPNWTYKKATSIVQELVNCGIATWESDGILLQNGAKLNGKGRSDVSYDFYNRPQDQEQNNPPTDTSRMQDDNIDGNGTGQLDLDLDLDSVPSAPQTKRRPAERALRQSPAVPSLPEERATGPPTGVLTDFLDPSQIPR